MTGESLSAAATRLHEATGMTAGNGSLMRTAPVALAYLNDPQALVRAAHDVSSLTHHDSEAGEACALWCLAIRHAVLHGTLDGLRLAVPDLPTARARVWPAPAPASVASAGGSAEAPICFSDSSGAPGSRRTRPPSWSVISSSGSARSGLSGLTLAWSNWEMTPAIWAVLPMLPPKKITPAASPCRIKSSNPAGGVSPW